MFYLDRLHGYIKHEEEFLTCTLMKNGYPLEFIQKYSAPKPKFFGPKGKRIILELPFLGDSIAKKYEKQLENVTKKVFPSSEPMIVWKCRRIPQRSLKDAKGEGERCGIIYQFKCACSSMYLGRTSRSLPERIREHIPQWLKAGKKNPPRGGNIQSSIAKHLIQCPVVTVGDADRHFSPIFQGVTSSKARILEALLIAARAPSLCKQKDGVYNLLLPW